MLVFTDRILVKDYNTMTTTIFAMFSTIVIIIILILVLTGFIPVKGLECFENDHTCHVLLLL